MLECNFGRNFGNRRVEVSILSHLIDARLRYFDRAQTAGVHFDENLDRTMSFQFRSFRRLLHLVKFERAYATPAASTHLSRHSDSMDERRETTHVAVLTAANLLHRNSSRDRAQ